MVVKVEELRPGDVVRDEEGGTGKVVRVYSYFLPFPGVYGVEVTYSAPNGEVAQMEDVAQYRRGVALRVVERGSDA